MLHQSSHTQQGPVAMFGERHNQILYKITNYQDNNFFFFLISSSLRQIHGLYPNMNVQGKVPIVWSEQYCSCANWHVNNIDIFFENKSRTMRQVCNLQDNFDPLLQQLVTRCFPTNGKHHILQKQKQSLQANFCLDL